MNHTKEFEAACNGEIDIITDEEMGDDIVAELDDWAEIGWLLLECGCLVSKDGYRLHGPVPDHLGEKEEERQRPPVCRQQDQI